MSVWVVLFCIYLLVFVSRESDRKHREREGFVFSFIVIIHFHVVSEHSAVRLCTVHTFSPCYNDQRVYVCIHVPVCVCARSLLVIRPWLSLPPPCMSQSCSTVWEGLGLDILLVARPDAETHTFVLLYLWGPSVMEYIHNFTTFESTGRDMNCERIQTQTSHTLNTLYMSTDTCRKDIDSESVTQMSRLNTYKHS